MVQNPYSINYERAILHHHIPDEPYHVSSAAYDAAYLLKMYPMKIEHRTAPSNSPIYHLPSTGPRTKDPHHYLPLHNPLADNSAVDGEESFNRSRARSHIGREGAFISPF